MWDVEYYRLTSRNVQALIICQTSCPVRRECVTYYRPAKTHMCIAGGYVWTCKGPRQLTNRECKRFDITPPEEGNPDA